MGIEDGLNKLRISPNLQSALDRQKIIEAPLWSEGWLKGQVLIQRDSGKPFQIVDFQDGRSGRLVRLQEASGSGPIITLAVNELVMKLQTAGSPWRVEERG